jgi:hypothetical protein
LLGFWFIVLSLFGEQTATKLKLALSSSSRRVVRRKRDGDFWAATVHCQHWKPEFFKCAAD